MKKGKIFDRVVSTDDTVVVLSTAFLELPNKASKKHLVYRYFNSVCSLDLVNSQ